MLELETLPLTAGFRPYTRSGPNRRHPGTDLC
jgi:hypothetical protein